MTLKKEIVKKDYEELYIPLDSSRDNKLFNIVGDRIVVVEITGTLYVRIQRRDNDKINLAKVSPIETPGVFFTRLYFTNDAQAGKYATLLIGREASFVALARIYKVGLVDTEAKDIDPAVERRLKSVNSSADLSIGAMSFTTSVSGRFRLESISIRFSVAVSPTVDVTLDSKYGSSYDTRLRHDVLAANQYYFATFGEEYELENGDEIKIDITSVAATAYVVIRYLKGGN